MGMTSALNAGVTGLAVNTSRLAAISDNIANSGTNGYKRATVDFSSVVISETGGRYAAGGVRSTALREVDSRGTLVTSSNSTDIAITGRGMLPVTTVANRDDLATERPFMMVSTGAFTQDDEGYLRTASGLQLLGWETPNGAAPTTITRSSAADLEPVQIQGFNFASNPTTTIDAGINLPADAATGDQYSTSVEYYDELGTAHSLNLQFTKNAAANAWDFTFSDTQGTIAFGDNTSLLTFNATSAVGPPAVEAGSLASLGAVGGAGGDMALGTAGTGTFDLTLGTQAVTLRMGTIGRVENMSQFASGFAPVAVTKDGNPIGSLARLEVTEKGFIDAIYDSGFRRTVYQIPVVDVPNLNGLTAADNQAFEVSAESGSFYLFDAGTGPTGGLLGFTVEQSTSDIAAELTQLIETQRAYSSNATIVRTVDEMLQETTNLKR